MIKKYPLTFRSVVFVVLPIACGFLYFYLGFKSSLSPNSGTLSVDGLEYSVQISHDPFGTPSIKAETDNDAYFALGFKHASDRLWQLELQRRLAQGRLSEVLGVSALQDDIWMRTLSIEEAAHAAVTHLKPSTIEALQAYANGINAWMAQTKELPPEFTMLGFEPEPWLITDSISWQKVFAYVLNGNLFDELRRDLLLQKLSPEQLSYFYSYDPIEHIAEYQSDIGSDSLVQAGVLKRFGIGHKNTGSNAWVIAGTHTLSGSPILANDPHLGLQLPALWYAASLEGKNLNVSGMTLVGLPMVIFGQNHDIAWGGTSLMSDQQDLFVETTAPQRPNQYLNGDQWLDFESRVESFEISSGFPSALNESIAPVKVVVRKTIRGPVITDARSVGDSLLSLRWAALDDEDKTIDAFMALQYAKNWQSFRDALANLKAPGLNFLYADRTGNIGHQVAGKLPVRERGLGILPQTTSNATGWLRYQDFNVLPSIFNPESGYLVSANEALVHNADLSISHEWAPDARHQRISNLIEDAIDNDKLLSIENMNDFQSDNMDLTALTLLPELMKLNVDSPRESEAIAMLAEWDGRFDQESVGATIFATWSYFLLHSIFDEVLSYTWQRPEREALLASSIEQIHWSKLAEIISTNSHGWCSSDANVSCDEKLLDSLIVALDSIEKITGSSSVSKWHWSKMSQTEFVHLPFGQAKGIGSLFKRTASYSTSPNSINASNNQFDSYKGFRQNFGAAFRQVIELDKDNEHWYMISTGQSGNIMSPHFDDMIDQFASNQLTLMDVDSNTSELLTLEPAIGIE